MTWCRNGSSRRIAHAAVAQIEANGATSSSVFYSGLGESRILWGQRGSRGFSPVRPIPLRFARRRGADIVQEKETIAVVFDFDDTLAPDSTSSFLDSCGIDVKSFWADDVQPLLDAGWDPVPAYLYMMVQKSNASIPGMPITREGLVAWGKQISPYPGATTIFNRLRRTASSIDSRINVEFYLISSGIGEILRATRIGQQFNDIWACDFLYDEAGGIVFPKNVVSFTDKTRYLFQISKGLVGPAYKGKPFDVNRKVSSADLRIPFDQIVYVGDGYTDIPCFSLVRKERGVAIGVYDRADHDRWGRAWGFVAEDRVSNLAAADYSSKSALADSLTMAVERMSNQIVLRRMTYQG